MGPSEGPADMRSLRVSLYGIVALTLFGPGFGSHAQQTPQNTPTIRVTSRLVFLDVTVLDKKGRPVVKGLTKDDFTITDNKIPQRIFRTARSPCLRGGGARERGPRTRQATLSPPPHVLEIVLH